MALRLPGLIAVALVGCAGPATRSQPAAKSDWCAGNGSIEWLLKPTLAGYIDTKDVSRRANTVRAELDRCPKAARNLRQFVTAVARQHDDGYKFGFAISDRDYELRNARALELPALEYAEEHAHDHARDGELPEQLCPAADALRVAVAKLAELETEIETHAKSEKKQDVRTSGRRRRLKRKKSRPPAKPDNWNLPEANF